MTVAEMASSGGRARARNMTAAQRTASAKKAAAARWCKKAVEEDAK